MHADHNEVHHRPRHIAEKVEGLLGKAMVGVVVILAVAMVWMLLHSDSTPAWMR